MLHPIARKLRGPVASSFQLWPCQAAGFSTVFLRQGCRRTGRAHRAISSLPAAHLRDLRKTWWSNCGAVKRANSSTQLYASNPERWLTDPAVESYGKHLAAESDEPDALIEAASLVRGRLDLPADLRASAGRAQARALFKQAVAHYEGLKVSVDEMWPASAHKEALSSVTRASKFYNEVLEESSNPELTELLRPQCPEWPAAVAATEVAYKEVRKLEVAVRRLEVTWLSAQIERSRAWAHYLRSGDNNAAAQQVDRLCMVGLPEANEQNLLVRVIQVVEHMIEACGQEPPADEELKTMRAHGQVLLIGKLNELALSCACASDMEGAAKHIIRALSICPDNEGALSAEAAEHLKEVAQAVWEHCTKSINATTAREAEQVLKLSTDLGGALVQFNARRFSQK